MARTIPVDLALARHGYLVAPDGHVRHVIGLDTITRDIVHAGATLEWADVPANYPALSHVETRCILLAPWMFWALPAYLRRVLTEELGHCVVGHCEERVHAWQWRHYGDVLLPGWVA